MATLTLIGLYNYDNTLFDNWTLPDGVDADTLKNTILLDGGEFEALYSDIDFLKLAIETVADKWYRTFEKWTSALNLTYDPIYNYDRYESWTDDGTTKNTDTTTNKGTAQSSGKSVNNSFVNAYDNNTLVQDAQTEASQTEQANTSNTNNSTQNGSHNTEHTGHIYGNIGVTTSQDMLKAELDLARWNLYEHIASVFIRELCIMVY